MLKIEKTLKEIEKILNSHGEYEDDYFDWKLYLINKEKDSECCIVCDVLDSDETILHKIQLERIGVNAEDILLDLIGNIYDNNINWMNKFIKGTKGFNLRKIKSICHYDSKGNKDKVDTLVQDLIIRYKTDYKMKSDVTMYTHIVSDLYKCLDEINPFWHKIYLANFVREKVAEFGYDAEIIANNDNMAMVVNYNGKKIQLATTSKTKKKELLEAVIDEIRGVK